MKTSFFITRKSWVNILKFDIRQKISILFNRSLGKSFRLHSRNKQKGRLNQKDINGIRNFQIKKCSSFKSAKRYLKVYKVNQNLLKLNRNKTPMQVNCTRLLDRLIAKHTQEINTVTNIGCRLDTVNSYLSSKYKNINFYSIDFQDNISEYNHFVLPKRNNWHFQSGYALDLLINKKVLSDLYFMTSTSILFNNKELDLYLYELSKSAKFIVINEPWYPKANTLLPCRLIPPEKINPNNPYTGGLYMNYHHNYNHKLRQNGFKILSSEIFSIKNSSTCNLQLVALKD